MYYLYQTRTIFRSYFRAESHCPMAAPSLFSQSELSFIPSQLCLMVRSADGQGLAEKKDSISGIFASSMNPLVVQSTNPTSRNPELNLSLMAFQFFFTNSQASSFPKNRIHIKHSHTDTVAYCEAPGTKKYVHNRDT